MDSPPRPPPTRSAPQPSPRAAREREENGMSRCGRTAATAFALLAALAPVTASAHVRETQIYYDPCVASDTGYETTDPAPSPNYAPPAAMRAGPLRAAYIPPGDGSACTYAIDYWDVDPAYTGPAYETSADAAAADPAPPAPPPVTLP